MAIAMTSTYSDDTQGARVCLERALDLVQAAVRSVPASGGRFRFLDLGAADGGTARGLWHQVLEAALARPDVERFELVANDLPSPGFGDLAANVAAAIGEREDALGFLVPRSFYLPCVDASSAQLIFSATAMHWLSARPRLIGDHTHANATGDGEARAAFAEVAQRDWRALLARRAEELAPGGEMVLVNLARDDEGRFLGRTGQGACMHDTLHELWRDLRDEGRIDADAYRRGTFQNFYKSEEELTACLRDPRSEPHQRGLRLVSSRIEVVPCVYRARFDVDGDVDAFADGLMRTVRSWSEHTFVDAAGGGAEAREVASELYRRYRDRIASEPGRHAMDYVQSYLRIRRERA
ncbi:MAG: SAM-dependent methyltransferase [Sandaracinaceae bacterium]